MSNPLKDFVIQNFKEINPKTIDTINKWQREFIGNNISKLTKLTQPMSHNEAVINFNQMCETRDQLIYNFNKGIYDDI